MTTNAYPETNVQVIEKALYCLKHGETESVENWLDLLRERLTENSRADALTGEHIGEFARSLTALSSWHRDYVADKLRSFLAASHFEQLAAAPIGAVRAYGVFRTRPDENDRKEFFYHANWHNDYRAQEGERIVEGWFAPAPAPSPADERAAFEFLRELVADDYWSESKANRAREILARAGEKR